MFWVANTYCTPQDPTLVQLRVREQHATHALAIYSVACSDESAAGYAAGATAEQRFKVNTVVA